jgi:xylulose-5-phosphate/fructose-6-phosphate phosphoketolase
MDTIDGFPQLGESELVLKHKIKKKLIKRKGYINKNGQDMPETRDWNWKQQQ